MYHVMEYSVGLALLSCSRQNDDQKERYLLPTLRGEKSGFLV